jgi:splicing factor 3B subunit 2
MILMCVGSCPSLAHRFLNLPDRWVSLWIKRSGENLSPKKVRLLTLNPITSLKPLPTEEEEEDDESEDESGDETEPTGSTTDGIQTPSGLDTPSGMTSVVSTVAGGLETPDFIELRKTTASREQDSGPRSLYQVLPEKQTAVRGLMGSERGYDVSAAGAVGAIPVLGDERGTKVCL